jgi:hypothetical protein
VREKIELLEQEAISPTVGEEAIRAGRQVLTEQADRSGTRGFQTAENAEEGALSTAGRTDEAGCWAMTKSEPTRVTVPRFRVA